MVDFVQRTFIWEGKAEACKTWVSDFEAVRGTSKSDVLLRIELQLLDRMEAIVESRRKKTRHVFVGEDAQVFYGDQK